VIQIRKLRTIVLATVVAGAMSLPALPASAAPITCPNGQRAVHTAEGKSWYCENNGGNTSQGGSSKNEPKGKHWHGGLPPK